MVDKLSGDELVAVRRASLAKARAKFRANCEDRRRRGVKLRRSGRWVDLHRFGGGDGDCD